VRADLPAFQRALVPLYSRLDRRQFASIESLKTGIPRDPAPTCGGAQITRGRVATPLDGVYTKTITPAVAHSTVPENYGTFVRVFDRGRWALTQHSRTSCYWGYGRYSINGNRVHFVVTDGGGITPTNAGAKPGETVSLEWRVFRNALSLTAPDNPDPGAYQRVSATPSSRYLDGACPPPARWDR
jgi:hypothetical protein